ncbi:hypothetical protein ABZ897_62005 [Nonomuraea sp. NPDC046802]|uniref:hypothetical protein n=1 Tax=Nonomuraea sp. NPDC046802 TaxID=3154919 RepID=UPI0033D29223
MLRTPSGRRQVPTADLAVKAAGCGRLSAVLALLPELPMPSAGLPSSRTRP